MVESVMENVWAEDIRPLPDFTSMNRLLRDIKDNVLPLRTTTWKLKARITEGCANTDHSAATGWSRLDVAGARCELCLRNTLRLVFEVECVYSLYHTRDVSNERLNSWRSFANIEWLCVSRYGVESPTFRILKKIRDQKIEAVRTIAAWLEWWRSEAQI